MKSIIAFLIILFSCTLSVAQYQQIYFQEDFNTCGLPAGWQATTQNPLSKGWQIGDSATVSTSRMPVPDNGGCFAILNDGDPGNPAAEDVLISPSMDLTNAVAPVVVFDVFVPAGGWFYVQLVQNGQPGISLFTNMNGYFFERKWQRFEWPMTYVLGARNDISFRFVFQDWGFNYQGAAIDNFMIVDPLADDLSVTYIEPIHYYEIGNFPLKGRVRNRGSNTVSNYVINWQIDNGQVQSQSITNALQAPFFKAFDLPNALNFTNTGKHVLKVWTSDPNGRQDGKLSNDTLTQSIQVVNYLPPKRVLVEEFGHTTCGPCYRANQEFQQMLDARPETAVGIAIHDAANDPMTTPEGVVLDSVFVRAHPSFVVDRFKYIHNPEMWIHNGLNTMDEVDLQVAWGEAVEVTIENSLFNPVTREISLDAVATFYGDYEMPLALNVAVIEDSVFGYQTSAPDPNNYWHMHVLRKMLGGAWGDNSSFPASIPAGQRITQSFSYTLPANFKAKDVKVIAFLQRQSENLLEKEIINSTKAEEVLNFANDVVHQLPAEIQIYPNPAKDILFIESSATPVSVIILDVQGNRLLENKVVNGSMDISRLSPGIYLIAIQQKDNIYYQKLMKK